MESRMANEIDRRSRNHNNMRRQQPRRSKATRSSDQHFKFQNPRRLPRTPVSPMPSIQATERATSILNNSNSNNYRPKRSKSLPHKPISDENNLNQNDMTDLPDYETAVRKLNTNTFHIPLDFNYDNHQPTSTTNNQNNSHNFQNSNILSRFYNLNKNKTSFFLALTFIVIVIMILMAIFVVIILNIVC